MWILSVDLKNNWVFPLPACLGKAYVVKYQEYYNWNQSHVNAGLVSSRQFNVSDIMKAKLYMIIWLWKCLLKDFYEVE